MILSVGEILIDSFKTLDTTSICIGGAPFNVAVWAKRNGARVGFVGRVGRDEYGSFIIENADKYNLDRLEIIPLKGVATTVAQVSLDENAERHFKFFRDNTADYQFAIGSVDIEDFSPTILHLGTLMLNEEMGRKFALDLLEMAKKTGVKISIDVNFRDDLFESKSERNLAFKPFVNNADYLKMGLDEILDYTGESCLEKAIKNLKFKGVLFVTDGKNGSRVFLGEESALVPSENVKAVDTTGAGDAYWGCVLAQLDQMVEQGKILTLERLIDVAKKANLAGAEAVTRIGAI